MLIKPTFRHRLLGFLALLFSYQAQATLPVALAGTALPSLAPMLEKVTPAVVNIATKTHIKERENPLLRDPFFRRFFALPKQTAKRSSQSLGSGVIINAKKGYILTNHHVIAKADEITVTLRDGRVFVAKTVGSDPESDVAVIQISAPELTALPVADSEKLRVGDFVVAIGNPFGLGQTVTSGIISALGRSGLGIEGYEDFIQTDASINPGNSGGALVNLAGELIGINTAIIAPNGGNVGIGFAIPSNMAISLQTQLIKFGVVTRGQLGISVQDLTAELSHAFKLKQAGVIISQVQADSSASAAGLLAGDVILAINSRAIKNTRSLRNTLGLLSVGDTAQLDILRNAQALKISLEVRKKQRVSVAGKKLNEKLAGASFADLEQTNPPRQAIKMVAIVKVEANSAAWLAGLRQGDIIVKVNRMMISDISQLTQATKNQQSLLLNIQRGNTAFFIFLR